jgi:hypothetical protein
MLSLAPDAKIRLPIRRIAPRPAPRPTPRPIAPRPGPGSRPGASGMLGDLVQAGAGALGNLGQGGGGGGNPGSSGGDQGPAPSPAQGGNDATAHQQALELACITGGRTLVQCGLRP